MDEKIRELRERARAAIAETAESLSELNDIRVKFLGKKGEMTALLRSMSALAQEERASARLSTRRGPSSKNCLRRSPRSWHIGSSRIRLPLSRST